MTNNMINNMPAHELDEVAFSKCLKMFSEDLLGWMEGIAIRLDDLRESQNKGTSSLIESLDSICNFLSNIQNKMP